MLRELPNRPLAWALRCFIWPRLWVAYHEPKDELKHRLARLLMTPSDTRARLVEGIDQSEEEKNPIY